MLSGQATFDGMRYLGLDLGGTNIKGAVVDAEPGSTPSVIATSSTPTEADKGPAAVAQRMIELAQTMTELLRVGPA